LVVESAISTVIKSV